ncbi:MAG TPA: universal stress protein [Methylomirabilota bacterium]|jgi:nucleotide-binding universal stress UspA family protein|nr:universal stress protein [Methylomirabilota bacterium]
MAKRILVPLDRETPHETILPLVADLAVGGGATLRFLHVAPLPDNVVDEDGRVVAYTDQEAQRLETEWRDGLLPAETALPPLAIEHAVRFGEPVAEILAEADAFGADLIAVTTPRRSAVRCAVLGSVADQLVRRAKAAVLLLRPVILALVLLLGAAPVWAQSPAAPHHPPAAAPAPSPGGPAGGGAMPMMDMCRQMMAGPMPGMGGDQMGADAKMDPKMMAHMLQMRGEMMKAMGEIMMKHGAMMQGVPPKK